MSKNGYFDAEVKDNYHLQKEKAIVRYTIIAHKPSFIKYVARECTDDTTSTLFFKRYFNIKTLKQESFIMKVYCKATAND